MYKIQTKAQLFYGLIAAKESGEEPSLSSLSRYGCGNRCCSRIDNQTTILKRISYSSEKLIKDVGEIKTRVLDNIPSQLRQQAMDLDALKTSLGNDISSKLEKLMKASVNDIAISLNKHSEERLVHDARLK